MSNLIFFSQHDSLLIFFFIIDIFSDHEIHRKSRPSSSSPLKRSEVHSSSSTPGLFGKPAASSSSSLFGKPSTSLFATSQGDGLPSSAMPSAGLFGKEPGSSVFSSGSGGSSTQTEGNVGFQSGGTLFGKTLIGPDSGKSNFQSSKQDSAPVIKALFGKPVVMSEPSSTTTSSAGPEKVLFGKTEPTSSAVHPIPKSKLLFGKPTSVSPPLANEGRGRPTTEGLLVRVGRPKVTSGLGKRLCRGRADLVANVH